MTPEQIDRIRDGIANCGCSQFCSSWGCRTIEALLKDREDLATELEKTRASYSQALDSLALAEKHSDEFAAEVEKLKNPGDWWECPSCDKAFWLLNSDLSDCAEVECPCCAAILIAHDHGSDGFELRPKPD